MNILHCIPGPFFRKSKNDTWHWMKDCEDYPAPDDIIEDPYEFISSKFPEGKLCPDCLAIFKQNELKEI